MESVTERVIAVEPCSAAANESRRTWRAGSLIYTAPALVGLFALLLVGDFAWSMRDRSVAPMAQWYLNHLGIPSLLFGLLISSFPALIGLILGPIISIRSDRHRSRRGRRIPFLLVTTPIAAFGMIGLGLTPLLVGWIHARYPEQNEMLIAVLCFAVFWTIFEVATIAGQAVFGGLINDVVPRELIGRFYGLFRAVSLIDGMIFNFWLTGKVPAFYTVILLAVGLFFGTAFLAVCFRIREGEYAPPEVVHRRRSWLNSIKAYLRECFASSFYLQVFVLLTVGSLAFVPINTFSIPYAQSLGIDMDTYGKSLALTYLVSLSLSWFLGWMADLFHPLRVVIATLILYIPVAVAGALLARSSDTFVIVWVLHGVLSGCYFTSVASLGQRLFPNARFAQFASAAAILLSLGNMIIGPLMGVLVDATGREFSHTFTVGAILSSLALVLALQVYSAFLKLGGHKGYVAPVVA